MVSREPNGSVSRKQIAHTPYMNSTSIGNIHTHQYSDIQTPLFVVVGIVVDGSDSGGD